MGNPSNIHGANPGPQTSWASAIVWPEKIFEVVFLKSKKLTNKNSSIVNPSVPKTFSTPIEDDAWVKREVFAEPMVVEMVDDDSLLAVDGEEVESVGVDAVEISAPVTLQQKWRRNCVL